MAYVNLGQVMYPVGSVYHSFNTTSPASIFGGSWSALNNQFLLSSNGNINTTGGEWNHTLSTNEMPSHTHVFSQGKNGGNRESIVGGTTSATYGGGTTGWTTAGSIFDAFIVPSGGGYSQQYAALYHLSHLEENSLSFFLWKEV